MRRATRQLAILTLFVLATAYGATAQLREWPWLGVSITDITSGNVEGYTGGGGGAYVTGVDTPGPAANAGLNRHDIIVGLNGRATINTRELTCLLHGRRPGEPSKSCSHAAVRAGQPRSPLGVGRAAATSRARPMPAAALTRCRACLRPNAPAKRAGTAG